ncbi:Lactation elevated protein 1 [Hordeum vulgare]|nr:Lactation elevated protein 1 [Hordeum vulgare]
MEDPMLSPITVEVAHAPFPRADLVAGHVAPAAIAQAHAAPSRKRHGNVVVQGGNPVAGPRRDGPRSGRQRRSAIPAGGGEGRQGRGRKAEEGSGFKREQEAASLREKIDAMVQSNELMLLKSLEIKKEFAEKKAKEKKKNGHVGGFGGADELQYGLHGAE